MTAPALQGTPSLLGYPQIDHPLAPPAADDTAARTSSPRSPRASGALSAVNQPPAITRAPAATLPAATAASTTIAGAQASARAAAAPATAASDSEARLARRTLLRTGINPRTGQSMLAGASALAGLGTMLGFVPMMAYATGTEGREKFVSAAFGLMVGGGALTMASALAAEGNEQAVRRDADAYAHAYHDEQMDLMERGELPDRRTAAAASEPTAIDTTRAG